MGELIKLNERNGFRISNKNETEAEITIYSQIGDSFWDESFSAKDFDTELKKLPKTITDITVRLNSPGGDVFQGITIYNRLKQHKAKITVYIDGLAASIASVIAMAGDEIIIGEGALFMIHKPMTGIYGNSSDLLTVIDRLDDVEEQILNIYKKKTGKDRTELQALIAGPDNEDGTWMDADEAIEHGFVDRKFEEEEVLDIAATITKTKWFKNRPKNLAQNKHIKNKLNDLRKNVDDFLAH